ncbi:Ras GTPase-activating protein 1 [Quaeritorhiza haematococci]|nr:Ras GTPase-activating protein 1 [Quaeritorhiza haematococci]
MTFDSVMRYTEESVRQCRELVAFLKKRQTIESEYAKALAKMSQGFQKQPQQTASQLISQGAAPGSPEVVKAQLLQTSLWKEVNQIVEKQALLAEAHRQLASSIANNILEPFSSYVKEMEIVRKSQMEKGMEYTRNLQDAYTGLKKAKRDYDCLQQTANENATSLQKAQQSSSARDRDVDKLRQRTTAAIDKANHAQDTLQVIEDICRTAQDDYYTRLMPSLLDDIRNKEEERCLAVKRAVADWVNIEKFHGENQVSLMELFGDRINAVDVGEDMLDFVEYHLSVSEEGDKDRTSISVRSLVNPLKAGRMLMKRGDVVTGWSSKYFVLMAEDRSLYCFDSEDATKVRDVIALKDCSVYPLDDSYFGKPNCLQILVNRERSDIAKKGQQRSDGSPTQRQVYNLVAETAADREVWIQTLKQFVQCCPSRKPSTANSNAAYFAAIAASSLENGYRPIRSLRLWIMEAKDIPIPSAIGSNGRSALINPSAVAATLVSKPVLGGNLYPYCVVLFDDVKQARTGTKAGDNPFWGETFYFSDISPHHTRLRILMFQHNKLQRDVDIGYVSINLNTIKTGKKVEEWYPIKAFHPEDQSTNRTGSMRVGVLLTNEHLLPMHEYTDFLNLTMEPSLRCIRSLGQVVVQQREELAAAVLDMLLARKVDIEGLKTMLREEILATDTPNILFRGNSLTTKALDQYMKLVGMDYLHSTISSLIRNVYKSKEPCEVDPTRLDQPDAVKKNFRRLIAHTTSFWEAIANSVDKCPAELLEVFRHIRKTVSEKFPDDLTTRHTSVSAFIFLRFFCPAILSPKLFGIHKEHPDQNTARNLTLITKILMNMANLTEFGNKELFMTEANVFIKMNLDGMRQFLDAISGTEFAKPSVRSSSVTPARDLRRATEALYQLFHKFQTPLKSLETAQTDPKLESLFPILDSLEAAHARYHQELSAANSSKTSSAGSLRDESPTSPAASSSTKPSPNISQSSSSTDISSNVGKSPPQIELNLGDLELGDRRESRIGLFRNHRVYSVYSESSVGSFENLAQMFATSTGSAESRGGGGGGDDGASSATTKKGDESMSAGSTPNTPPRSPPRNRRDVERPFSMMGDFGGMKDIYAEALHRLDPGSGSVHHEGKEWTSTTHTTKPNKTSATSATRATETSSSSSSPPQPQYKNPPPPRGDSLNEMVSYNGQLLTSPIPIPKGDNGSADGVGGTSPSNSYDSRWLRSAALRMSTIQRSKPPKDSVSGSFGERGEQQSRGLFRGWMNYGASGGGAGSGSGSAVPGTIPDGTPTDNGVTDQFVNSYMSTPTQMSPMSESGSDMGNGMDDRGDAASISSSNTDWEKPPSSPNIPWTKDRRGSIGTRVKTRMSMFLPSGRRE